jgi:putative spermidine/putrescine transport system permease protein
MSIGWRILARATAAALLALILAPLVYAVLISYSPGELLEPPTGAWSLRWYRQFFENPQWTAALRNSIEIAVLAAVGALAAGTAAALAVTRYQFRGREVFNLAIMLPLFVPTVVLGMALLPFMRVLGLWGSKLSIAVAHSLWSLPAVFLVTRNALEVLDSDLEHAARGLGAGPIRVFLRVTLPLIAPALAAGAVMAFVLSLNESVMALFLGTPSTETLPKVIWPNLRYTLSPLVAAASGVSMAVTVAGLFGISRLTFWKRR